MKDVCGNELVIGDKVLATVSHYEELGIYYVHSFTPQKIRLSKEVGGDYWTVKSPHQVGKIQS